MDKQEADEMNSAATSYAQELGYHPGTDRIAFSQKGKSQGGFTGGLQENVISNWEASMTAPHSSTGRKVRVRFGIEVHRVYERKSVGEEWQQTSIEFRFGDGTIHGYPTWEGSAGRILDMIYKCPLALRRRFYYAKGHESRRLIAKNR